MVRSARRLVKRGLLAVVACVLAGVSASARAAEFHAVLARFGNAPHAQAYLDVSFDKSVLATGPIDVLFDVFGADGALLATFAVRANADGFASSAATSPPNDNLFLVPGGDPALVRARIPSAATGGTATLHQRESGNNRLVLSVPADRATDGTSVHAGQMFTFHVDETAGTASILVANVSGNDVAADVFVGTVGAPGGGKYSNAQLRSRGTWRVELQPDDRNVNLILATTGEVIVQLVVDEDRLNFVTVIPTVG